MAEKIIVDDDNEMLAQALSRAEATSIKRKPNDEQVDVTNQYPRRKYQNQSSINKAALGNEKNFVHVGGGDAAVDIQSAIPASRYVASTYPKNQVRESPSGHVTEIDDTEGAERIITKHRSGSGVEMLADGTVIYSAVGNSVRVVMREEKVIVEGDASLSYNGNLTLDVTGDFNVKVGGNYNLEVGGNKVEVVDGAKDLTVGGKDHTTIKGNKTETVLRSETKQVFGQVYNVIKGNYVNLIEGSVSLNSKGILEMTSEDEITGSAPDMNLAATNMSVFGETGTIGGDTVTLYYRNGFAQSSVFTAGVTAPTFHGDLTGRADEAISADDAVYASYGGGPGSAEGWTNTNTATDLTETARPTSAILNDYLNNSDRAYARINIDPGDHIQNSIDRSRFYGGVTSKNPTIGETRALLKDPENTENKQFIGALLSTGAISHLYASPIPQITGRQVNPNEAKFFGTQSIGQSMAKSSKKFTLGPNKKLEEQLKKRGL